jgi:hypothetical protein
MKNIISKPLVAVFLLAVPVAIIPIRTNGEPTVLASNYDGSSYNLSAYDVGPSFGYTFSWGAKFTVAGTGDFDLTQVTVPLVIFGGNPDPNNYQLSIVSDLGDSPTENVLWSTTPQGVTSGANYSFSATGTVQGGQDYWLLFSPIAPDSGLYGWYFSAPFLLLLTPDTLPNVFPPAGRPPVLGPSPVVQPGRRSSLRAAWSFQNRLPSHCWVWV